MRTPAPCVNSRRIEFASRFTVYKDADLFDFINAPVGKGRPVEEKLRPLIAIPTTAGTGSETTGTAILDITSMNFKTGIANRALKPTLGIVDTLNTRTCSRGKHSSCTVQTPANEHDRTAH